ncbi:Rna recognition motif xs domain protein [Thalictrum thalictroides]|uniref:Rna recognition motif xs domain protein n=1 Tax=Thalictrum thalictroides TaxID=46969 RepID=A0A7J6UZK4_THATH|nr:Rna recognition motif xs domain protein [Thalictrum thalictroides]
MMKDPRHGDPRVRSPQGEKMRVHRSEWHPEPGGYAQEKRPLRNIRSLSPHELERSERMLDEYHHLGTSIEREDYSREFYEGRDDRAFRRSPPFERQPMKWSHIDEEISFRERRPPRDVLMESGEKYTLPEYRDFYGDRSSTLKHFGDKGPSSSRYDQENNMRSNDRSFFMSPQVGRPLVNSGRTGGSFPSSSSGNLGILREEEELRLLCNLRTNKLSARESYKEDDKPLTYSEDVYDRMLVSSHLKDFEGLPSGVSKENLLNVSQDNLQSYGYGKRQGKHGVFAGQDGYGQGPPSDFDRNLGSCLNDPVFHHHDSYSPDRKEHWGYYHEHGRRDEVSTGYRSEVYRKEQPNEGRGYTSRDLIRPTLSGPVVNEDQYIESSHKSLKESSSRGHHPLQGKPFTNYRDIKSNLLATDHDAEFFGSGTNTFGMKSSSDYERTASRGDYGFGRDAGPLSNKERLKRLQISEGDRNMHIHDLSPRRRMKAEELSIYDPTERMHKRRYPVDEEMSVPTDRNIRLSNRITSRPIQELSYSDEQWTNENLGGLISSKRLRLNHPQYQKSGRPYEGRIANRIAESDDWSSAHDLPIHLQRRSIDHYTKGDGSVNIKGHLRTCSTNYHKSYTMDRRQDSYQSSRTWKRNPDNDYDVVLTEGGNFLEDLDSLVKPDLPEDSDEFKQLVDNLFLQFCKQLNQKPTTRRRYREQGNAGILLCIVCGRHSKEFLDTRGLVTHAFMSHKFGKRAHHLALHKAVCVLMGWKSVVTSNGACVYEPLPETEALSLKEDLILWPPLVIIHNSFTLNENSDGQIITIEHMEAILRDMGVSGGKTKVRHGNPANQSIMVVKFLPTFSGLQEAEKLHKLYVENKRGRGEFQKLKHDNTSIGSKEAGGIPLEKVEHDLYGYMGVIEDLDKLDFDTKKKCVVKSKKAIQAIADAPLKTD